MRVYIYAYMLKSLRPPLHLPPLRAPYWYRTIYAQQHGRLMPIFLELELEPTKTESIYNSGAEGHPHELAPKRPKTAQSDRRKGRGG